MKRIVMFAAALALAAPIYAQNVATVNGKPITKANVDEFVKLLGTQGVVDLTLSCGYYTAINMAQIALMPEMEPGKTSTL